MTGEIRGVTRYIRKTFRYTQKAVELFGVVRSLHLALISLRLQSKMSEYKIVMRIEKLCISLFGKNRS